MGTKLRIKIPLTLTIVPAIIIRAFGQRFAIQQNKLVELVLIDQSNPSGERIEALQGSPVLRLRGKILPLLSLANILSSTPLVAEGADLRSAEVLSPTTYISVLNADGFQFGLIVDAIEDTADIVVKALPPFLKDISQFSGATIMGDGLVALTLDIKGISSAARLRSEEDQALMALS